MCSFVISVWFDLSYVEPAAFRKLSSLQIVVFFYVALKYSRCVWYLSKAVWRVILGVINFTLKNILHTLLYISDKL